MTKRIGLLAVLALAICSWNLCAAPVAPTVTLFPPDGNISGFPGQTVGWGVLIQNTADASTNIWVVITGSQFCGVGGDPNTTDCSNGLPGPYVPYDGVTQFGTSFGIYTDYLGPQHIVLSPFEAGMDTFFSFPFSPGHPGMGVGQYAIFANAKPGVDMGNIFITYNLFDGDPRMGGTQDSSDPGNLEVSSPVSVTIMAVPEPATLLLAGGALLAFVALRRLRNRR